jgi:L-amino acid N-acyltransferase YncA
MVLFFPCGFNKQIAATIGITEATVKVHRGQVIREMRTKSLPELVRIAHKLGIHQVVGLLDQSIAASLPLAIRFRPARCCGHPPKMERLRRTVPFGSHYKGSLLCRELH